MSGERLQGHWSSGLFVEDTEILILAFTSKTGQSVALNRHRIFLFRFFSQREDIFRHFISLISDSRVQEYSR